jgi:triacylglycerol lipase
MTDLEVARLVQIAGIDGPYGPPQFEALEAQGLKFLNEIRGADLPPSGLQTRFGYVAQMADADKTLVVCLRGTDPRRLLEWLDDAVALPADCPWGHGLIHVGFLEVYKSLQLIKEPGAMAVPVADYLKSLLQTQQSSALLVAGHSLGGALSTILADHMDFLSHNGAFSDFELSAVTFASPRTGDKDWAHWYDLGLQHTTRRYENPWDLVPQLPTNPPFEHVNNKMRLKAPFDLDLIKNHLLSTYIELLEKP